MKRTKCVVSDVQAADNQTPAPTQSMAFDLCLPEVVELAQTWSVFERVFGVMAFLQSTSGRSSAASLLRDIGVQLDNGLATLSNSGDAKPGAYPT